MIKVEEQVLQMSSYGAALQLWIIYVWNYEDSHSTHNSTKALKKKKHLAND